MTAQRVAISLLRFGLGTFIAAAFLAFIFITFIRTSSFSYYRSPWKYSEDANTALTIQYNAMVKRYAEEGAVFNKLTYGPDSLGFLVWFGSVVAAALGTFALRSLPTQRKDSQNDPGHRSSASVFWRRVKRVIFYQLPPRRAWLWWAGGVTLLDAIIFLTVCAVTILWTQQQVSYSFGYIEEYLAAGTFDDYYSDTSVSLVKLERIAQVTGWSIYPPFVILFLAIPRNSFLQELFGVDFTGLLKYHRWMGHLVLIWTSIHGILYYVLWGIQGNFRAEFRHWQYDFISSLAGSISYIFGLIMWASSIEYIRRKYFEVFYKLHIVGALGFYIFGFMHYDGFWWFGAPGIMLYFLDLTFRLAQWMNVTVITGMLVSEDILSLQLSFAPETQLQPNSFVFMCCPEVSRMQWHPFTLSCVSNSLHKGAPAHATIYLKPYGRWVQGVVRRIAANGAVLAKVDGPYGGASSLVQGDVQVAVILAGGIGVTPMLGILAALRERRAKAATHGSLTCPSVPQRVVFVWACRGSEEFEILDEQLLAEARQPDSWLDIQLHQTGKPGVASKGSAMRGSGTDQGVTEGKLEIPTPPHAAALQAAQSKPQLTLASPFFLKPSLLQAYGIGYPVWALLHVAAFVGAYFCVLPAAAWFVVNGSLDPETKQSDAFWLVTTVEMVAMIVGTMGMPALIIFPYFLWRRRKIQRDMAARSPDSHTFPDRQGSLEAKVEQGLQPYIAHGRPDIWSILQGIRKQYDSLPEIHVHVCGPPGMVHDVKHFTSELNAQAGQGPHILCEVGSFNF